jgi:hypothetical protein
VREDLYNDPSIIIPCASGKEGVLYSLLPAIELELLDYYTGSAAAYSLRSLSESTTNVVKVRRSGDDAELDFTAEEVSDGTLVAWVVAGGGTEDGFVTTWYDQSGNANNATQATAANQPKIVSSGTLVTENGKAAVQWDNTDDYLSFSISYPTSSIQIHATYKTADTLWIMLSEPSKNIPIGQIGATNTATDGLTSVSFYKNGSLQSIANRGDVYTTYSTNNQLLMTIQGTPTNTSSATMLWGRLTAGFTMNALHQELIIYTSDQSANRTGIEANINAHYNIYS